jgi:FMN phosphatase YigB (HAD superfamily)
MATKRLLVCDLDNTLYDWVGYFVPSFYAMVDAVVAITGCDRERLLDDFRTVHQRQGDSEQPFSLLETDTIKEHFQGASAEAMLKTLDPAFHAFNSARKKNLRLHVGVMETLEALGGAGVTLVAHTESKLYGVVDRLNRLDLFRFFSKIYCRERSLSPHPAPQQLDWLDRFPMGKIFELANHQTKPDSAVLLEICAREGFPAHESAYVGDSVARDVLMAKQANVFAIWAAYGSQHDPRMYDDLVRISHWTAKDVALEYELRRRAKAARPDFIAYHSFADVLIPLEIAADVVRSNNATAKRTTA